MHTIKLTSIGVVCTCGYSESTSSHIEAIAKGNKHGNDNRPSVILKAFDER